MIDRFTMVFGKKSDRLGGGSSQRVFVCFWSFDFGMFFGFLKTFCQKTHQNPGPARPCSGHVAASRGDPAAQRSPRGRDSGGGARAELRSGRSASGEGLCVDFTVGSRFFVFF